MAFFHISDFLYELSDLIHCRHFVDVFSPITSRNIIFFVILKKKNFKRELQYFTFLMSESFTMNHSMKLGALQGAFLIEFLKSLILWQHVASVEKMCQIVIISHNSTLFEKLNICIVCYITNHKNFWISKFILHHLPSERCFS